MKRIFLFLFFTFLATQANAKSKRRTHGRSNHINLTLETAFIFDPKDAYHDITLIKSIRDFLESLEGQIVNRTNLRTQPAAADFKLRDFVYELGKYLLTYTEQNIRSFTITFQDVIEDYYPTQPFKKLFFDPRLRTFVKNSIRIWSEMEPKQIHHQLRTMFMQPTYNETFSNFLYAVGSFYDKSEGNKLFKLANKFQKFPSKQSKLKKIMEKCLNYIIFDKFKKLNIDQRTTLVKECGHLADYVGVWFSNISSVIDDEEAKKRASENVTVHEQLPKSKNAENRKLPHIESNDQLSESDREVSLRPNDSLEKFARIRDPTGPIGDIQLNNIYQDIMKKEHAFMKTRFKYKV